MPLYIVRWPGLTASLVKARDEDDLLDVLDQVDNSEGCTWRQYDGPLFFNFHLPAEYDFKEVQGRPLSDADIVVGDVSKLLGRAAGRDARLRCRR